MVILEGTWSEIEPAMVRKTIGKGEDGDLIYVCFEYVITGPG